MDYQTFIEIFDRWLHNGQLTEDETTFVTLCILLAVALIIFLVTLLVLAHYTHFWQSVVWTLEDLWNYFKSLIKTNNES